MRGHYKSVHEHYGRQNTFRNNIFAFGEEGCLVFSSEERDGWVEWPAPGAIFENNIVVSNNQPMFADHTGYFDEPLMRSQLNLYWDYGDSTVPFLDRKPYSLYTGLKPAAALPFEAAQAMGLECGSRVEDPCFYDPQNGDFRLRVQSPAHALGFRPVDYSRVGVRPPAERLPIAHPVLSRSGPLHFGD